jgi:DNA-directed RNA polymerase, beta'' subunit/160 kD subunit
MRIRPKKEKKDGKKAKKTKQNKQDGEDVDKSEHEEEEGDKKKPETPDETLQEFTTRVNLYVAVHLSRASGSKRDHYKDGLVFQTRKDLINEFLKATILSKCQNGDCNASVIHFFDKTFLDCAPNRPAYTFRKEGHTKIIEYDLSRKQKMQQPKKRPDVLIQEKAASFSLLQSEDPDRGANSDIDMSEPESSDEEEEEMNAVVPQVLQPKAANGREKGARGRNERVVAPEECRAHLRRLFHKEEVTCSLLYGRHGPFAALSPEGLSFASADMFFMEVIPVAPTRFRPPAKMNETLFEHPQNELLAKGLNTSYRLRDLNIELRSASQKAPDFEEATRKKLLGFLLDNLVQLQIDVNSFMDSSKNPAPVRQGKLPPAGVKQGLEKKEGLFRKHMMVFFQAFLAVALG